MKKISVIIPTNEPKNYLFECLKAIKRQTLDSSYFEVLIILNGSKDPYYKNINEYLINEGLTNAKLEYIEKRGVSSARNHGLDIAKGNNITFIDDDDLISPNFLESLLLRSNVNNVVCSNVKAFTKDVDNTKEDYINTHFLKVKHNNPKFTLNSYRSLLSTSWGKLIPISVINNRRFNDNFRLGEDSLFMFLISDKIHHIILTHENDIYFRRLRNNSVSRKNNKIFVEYNHAISKIISYSKIYWRNKNEYNFSFYFTRLLGSVKVFLLRISNK